ncbi:MAG: hypothetical protein M9894_38565 [Planctomycetes bacterium]|nr:hypothetical protein [Planctomycetota bacterium]
MPVSASMPSLVRSRPARALALALALALDGCATTLMFPTPMGGVIGHLGLAAAAGRGNPEYLLFLPILLPDFVLSLVADVALLPVTGPAALVVSHLRGHSSSGDPAPPEEEEADLVLPRLELEGVPPTWYSEYETRRLLGLYEAGDRSPRALIWAAHVAERRGEPVQAITLADQAIAASPGHLSARLVRGRARLRLGDLDGAEADLRRVVEEGRFEVIRDDARRELERVAAARER